MKYDPESLDATLSRLITQLETVNKQLEQLNSFISRVDDRVVSLESWRTASMARVSALIMVGSGVGSVLGWLAPKVLAWMFAAPAVVAQASP